jgi:hypothetical protein
MFSFWLSSPSWAVAIATQNYAASEVFRHDLERAIDIEDDRELAVAVRRIFVLATDNLDGFTATLILLSVQIRVNRALRSRGKLEAGGR